ncbi:ABC transporter permease [Jonesia quinghaiensis]|uniref:ABC transporter permease n=1 Tax=Jonesia quinghaiensis TaxID=262806 RepID=UPI000688A117|nr:ABC transporter permease [Jonesia quinghaiensis]
MRKNIGRLAAAGVAILIGTAFVAATFVAGQLLVATTENQMTAPFADADLVVPASYQDAEDMWQYNALDEADRAALADVEGVKAVNAQPSLGGSATFGDKIEYTSVTITNDDPRLVVPRVDSGAAPATASEVALDTRTAERMGAGVGDSVALNVSGEPDDSVTMTVSGLTSDPAGVFAATSGSALVSSEGYLALVEAMPADSELREDIYQTLTVTLDDGVIPTVAAEQVSTVLDGQPALTPTQYAERQLGSLTGEANILTTIVLMFAAIALFVAGLVISNTFQVLVAQRAHTLALLRCVGANKRQIRNSVLVEAFVLGVAASVAGIIAGIGLIQGVLMVLSSMEVSSAIPTTVSIPATAVWVPLVVGTAVTVIAALVPARIATKVSPLAALRPQEGAGDSGKKVGIGRLIVSGLLLVSGGALLAGGLMMSGADDSSLEIAVVLGILGGALTFVGLITSSMLWMPRVVSSVGKLFSSLGAPAKLASANTMRNPRRTAATSTALFIGVTLVAMLSVGAATTRATLNNALDEQYPLDITVEQYLREGQAPASDSQVDSTLQQIRAIDGVNEIVHGRTAYVSTTYGSGTSLVESWDSLIAVDPANFDTVLRDTSLAGSLTDDRVLLSRWANANDIGDSMKLFRISYNDDGTELPLEEQPGYLNAVELTPVAGIGTDAYVVTNDTFDKILATDPQASDVVQDMYFIKVDDVNGAGDTVAEIREVFSGTDTYITGAVLEREMFQQAIDVMLLVLVGLLGVAVLIALIGVANTLSLSVIERRRESATLRAVGMSRRQLKRSLGMEGMLIAGIGALVGVVVGALYAWLGTQLLFGGFATPDFTVRFLDIALIMVVSIGAGLLASIAPARGAAKTSPVAALAVE